MKPHRPILAALTLAVVLGATALLRPGGGIGRATERVQGPVPLSSAETPVARPGRMGPAPTTSERSDPSFQGTISALGPGARSRMRWSWHPGCPVPLARLRLVTVDHWGFDGRLHVGEIVVNADAAQDVLLVFEALFDARYPIDRMQPVDAYRGDDGRSMAANNTSGFNCRYATGHPGIWSEHAFGLAIDVNPVQNPYVSASGSVSPPRGAGFVGRSGRVPGVIHPGDPVVRAFADIGWSWGGSWLATKDYQHFSANGR